MTTQKISRKGIGGRKRRGSLYLAKSGWRARVTVDLDGVSVQKSYDLETQDKSAARIKLRRLVAKLEAGELTPAGAATEAKRVETFAEAAERVHNTRKASVVNAG